MIRLVVAGWCGSERLIRSLPHKCGSSVEPVMITAADQPDLTRNPSAAYIDFISPLYGGRRARLRKINATVADRCYRKSERRIFIRRSPAAILSICAVLPPCSGRRVSGQACRRECARVLTFALGARPTF